MKTLLLFDDGNRALMFENPDIETVLRIEGTVVVAEFVNIGEGICGDYDPEDPNDVNLLRFDISIKRNGETEMVEDASYCTNMPADTDMDILKQALKCIYKEYANVLESDPECSVKKLGERLSWISPKDFE